ncbi:MAG: cytochrome b/b6 domain-containing protein, partial [Gaiellaceae bacterium]
MATDPRYVERFSRTERTLHWVHASAFFVLLGSGLVLYVPRLSEAVARRAFVKDVHVDTAIAWAVALALLVVLGDRQGLRKT